MFFHRTFFIFGGDFITHCFIINPNAGYKDISESLKSEVLRIFADIDEPFEFFLTKGNDFDDEFIKNRLETGEKVRFYACGGDGTVHNVVNSIYGYENASLAVVPCGTGNDYIKSIGGFKNLEDLIKNGTENLIDIIKVNNKFCINIASMGLDGDINANTLKYKKHPLFKGIAYYVGVLVSIFGKLGYKIKVFIDDETSFDTEILMIAVAKGGYYGKTFYAAPLSNVCDGFLDLCLVKKIPLFRILKLIDKYQKGTHVNNPKFTDILTYKKVKKLNIIAEKDLILSLDGEIVYNKNINIEIIPSKIRLFSLLNNKGEEKC